MDDSLQIKDLSFSGEVASDMFLSKPKGKIIKNLPIQKPLQINLRQHLKSDIILRILDDPILNEIESPKDNAKQLSVDNLTKSIDIGTQMTDRGTGCNCNKSILSSYSIDNKLSSLKSSNNSNLGNSEGSSKLTSDSSKESILKSSKYTSPLFKIPSLSSQVFKQRINARVMKMNSYSISRVSNNF